MKGGIVDKLFWSRSICSNFERELISSGKLSISFLRRERLLKFTSLPTDFGSVFSLLLLRQRFAKFVSPPISSGRATTLFFLISKSVKFVSPPIPLGRYFIKFLLRQRLPRPVR